MRHPLRRSRRDERHREPVGRRRQRPAHHLVPALHEGLRGPEGRNATARCRTARSTSASRPPAASRSTPTTTCTSPSARPPTSGVWKYSGPFPTSADARWRLRARPTAPGHRSPRSVRKELFIAVGEHGLVSPNAIVAAPGTGSWYVSSVFTGVINEYDGTGAYVRTVLEPPTGEGPGPEPISTGSPLGLGVAPDGTLYFADIGLVVSDAGIGPGDRHRVGAPDPLRRRRAPATGDDGGRTGLPRRHRHLRAAAPALTPPHTSDIGGAMAPSTCR